MRTRGRDAGLRRVVWQAGSWCLGYPDEGLLAQVPLLRGALAEYPPAPTMHGLLGFLDHLEAHDLAELQRHYVDVFDLSRKHALYLSYWTDGDTRRRGEVLARFKAAYRASGYLVDTHGELPDHLPLVLEFAAVVDPVAGAALLEEYRPSLELIRLGLADAHTPYAEVLVAVCATLPGPSPADRAAVQAMAAGPPSEAVGLEPSDARLLPVLS